MIYNLNYDGMWFLPKYLTLDINQVISKSTYPTGDQTFTDQSGGTTCFLQWIWVKKGGRLIDSGNNVTKYMYIYVDTGVEYPDTGVRRLTYSGEVVPLPAWSAQHSSSNYRRITALVLTGPSDNQTIVPGIDIEIFTVGEGDYWHEGHTLCNYLPSLNIGVIYEIRVDFSGAGILADDTTFKLYTPQDTGTYIVQRARGTVQVDKHRLREGQLIETVYAPEDELPSDFEYYVQRLP